MLVGWHLVRRRAASSLMLTPTQHGTPLPGSLFIILRDSFFVNLFSSLRQNTQSPPLPGLCTSCAECPVSGFPRAAAPQPRFSSERGERTRSPPLEPTDTRTHGARHCLARHCSLATVSRPSHANWQTNRFSPAAARPVAGRYKDAKRWRQRDVSS